MVKDRKIVAMNYRKNLYKLYANVKNVSSSEKLNMEYFTRKKLWRKKNVFKKINTKFNIGKDTLCNM